MQIGAKVAKFESQVPFKFLLILMAWVKISRVITD